MFNFRAYIMAATAAAASLSPLVSEAFMMGRNIYIAPKIGYSYSLSDFNAHTNIVSNVTGGMHPSVVDPHPPYDNTSSSDGFDLFSAGLALGIDFNSIRVEGELIYFGDIDFEGVNSTYPADYKDIYEISALAGFVNLYYDIETFLPITPYIGGGVGLSSLETNYFLKASSVKDAWVTGSENTENFAWHIGAGVAYSVTNNTTLDLSYRFMNLGDYTVSNEIISKSEARETKSAYDISGDYTTHQVMLGLRINF